MNEESLFAAALEKSSTAERQAFLDEACGGDVRLRRRVGQLLAADARARGILEEGPDATGLLVEDGPDPALEAGRPFADRFRLVRQLGEGGMGEVWVADQAEPVRRQVALKVIRPGLDSARLAARFDQERQALALMDHPNIAKVLDAGVACGRPYFVMELIAGVHITRYCDEANLSLRQRLELFIPVCHAVQHAHQKGVIHRDLKPSNVLVAVYDDVPVPKVIDFGVAKATGPRLADHTVSTEVGTLVGTVEYMSPEQAELNGPDADTRSDVYALGVVLYELLTGGVPFPRERLQAVPFTEMLRIIKEDEPQKPSDRLAGSATLPGVAAARHTEPRRLPALVRGELDWIVMKCLEKERGRRYETADALARDLERYLADEPVLAGPPAAGYRLRKFLRRHRGPAVAAGLLLLALVAGVVGTTVGLVRAERARETAQKRLEQVEKGIEVLGSIFDDLDPKAEAKEGRPLRALLGDRLDQAAAALEGEEVGDPLTAARLQDRLGRTYLGLGQAAKAEALFAKALATRQARLGPDHADTLGSLHNLALAYRATGKNSAAIPLFERVRDAQVKQHGADHPTTLITLKNLAWSYSQAGKHDEAIALLSQVRDACVKQHGADHPTTLDTLNELAGAYLAVRKATEAVDLLKRVRQARVNAHGDAHPRSVAALNNLAQAYLATSKMRLALELLEEARDAVVPKLGDDHPDTLLILNNLARLYRTFGRTGEAIDLAERVRAKQVMHLGAYHPHTIGTLENLALAYRAEGNLDRALPLFRQAAAGVELLQFVLDRADRIIHNLCQCLEQQKQYDEAEAWRRKWLAVVKEKDGPESAAYATEVKRLVRLYEAWGKPEEAARWRKELEARPPRAAGPLQE